MGEVISNRVLNRTLLDRQHLLTRSGMTPAQMIEHLIGLQAQDVMPPFVGLWSRLTDFDPNSVSTGLEDRALARVTLMRGTIHLVSALDARRMRPHFTPLLEAAPFRPGFFFGATVGMDIDEVRSRGVELFQSGPKKSADIRDWAKECWPDRDPGAVVQAMYYLLPLLQIPPRGKWKQNNRPVWSDIESWLGAPLIHDYPLDDLVLRYLRAFGPASTMDMQAWSRLKGFKSVVDRLGLQLRTYKDERGRVLYDTAEGELVAGDVDAPPRFLGWYDNVALSHDDRSRIVDLNLAAGSTGPAEGNVSTFTLDGFLAGSYKVNVQKTGASLTISPGRQLSESERQQLSDEGESLLRFMEPGHSHDIEFCEL